MQDSIIAITFKRSDQFWYIPLFEINWIEVSYVKENPYSLGSIPYYEIRLANGEFIKVSYHEISEALPEGASQLELDQAYTIIEELEIICSFSKNDNDSLRSHAVCYQYKEWIREKLGVELENKPGWEFFTRQGIEITPNPQKQGSQIKKWWQLLKKWWQLSFRGTE